MAAQPDDGPGLPCGGGAGASRRRVWLVLLCTGLVLVEALGLHGAGFRSALPLAPQVSAPAAFGVYHDLRWLFTYSWSWSALVWQLAGLLVFRTVLTVTLLRLAWPAGEPPPPWPRLLGRNAGACVLAVVALSPWAALAFAAQAVAYSWFMILSIVAAGVTALVLPPAVTGRWWRALRWRAAAWAALAWLAATVAALAISLSPTWAAILIAVLAGGANAGIWLGLVAGLVHAGPPPDRWLPPAPVAVVAVLAVFLIGGGYAVSGPGRPETDAAAVPPAPPTPGAHPVLYVPGFDSRYDGHPFDLFGEPGLRSTHFSYRGLGPAGPLPYDGLWTHQSVQVSADKLTQQVDWLAARTSRPVALVSDSEGTLVTRAYLARHPDAPVDYDVMASPLPRPAWVYYPPAGQDGYGLVAGWEVRALLRLLRRESPGFTATADMPFTRSVVDHAGFFRPAILCPLRGGIRSYAFIPLAGATVVYHGPVSHLPWTALPGWHASLLHRPGVADDIQRLLTTGRLTVHDTSTAAFRAIWGASAAWQVPALPLALRPAWHPAPDADPALAGWRCPD